MNYPLKYPVFPDLRKLQRKLTVYFHLKYEYGADPQSLQALIDELEQKIEDITKRVQLLPEDAELAAKEPNCLESIRKLRPNGPRVLWKQIDPDKYMDRLKGALIGRFAGCTLGAPVEGCDIKSMKSIAAFGGDSFPPEDYWSEVRNPDALRYGVSQSYAYSKKGINGVPVDDDVTYTILGLLIMEDYGPNFTIEDVGAAWVKYLPIACTAEEVALENLKKGIPAEKAGETDNPYVQWIGADIRSDPWGYLAPGLPEKAAEFAYRDACISHRRNGIYGEMYFSAVIAAAFATGNVMEALEIGLTEIPKDCMLANDIRWALNAGKNIRNYEEARKAVEDRFGHMSSVHTNNNACLTVFGLMIGGDDFTKVIGETVAMGYDNDCTAATAGSIFGAAYGLKAIPEKWYKQFNNKVLTYINGHPEFKIDDIVKRFAIQAERVYKSIK